MPAPSLNAPPGGFVGPVKRSITIAGHQTSISLEPLFWALLEQCAVDRALPLSALVGATFLVWADTLARSVFAPRELPVGVLTAFIGVPVFAWILRRRRAVV